jgi:hypothetical protein
MRGPRVCKSSRVARLPEARRYDGAGITPGRLPVRAYSPLLILFVAAGCADRKLVGERAQYDAAPTGSSVAAEAPQAPAFAAMARARKELPPAATPAPNATPQDAAQVVQRKLIRSANLRIEVAHVDSAMRLVDATMRSHEAVVANAQVSQVSEKRRDATVSINVPANRFDETLAALRHIGTVRNENVSTQDVSREYTDLEIRLGVKEQTVDRLRSLLGTRTAKLSDVLELERELGRAIAELEQMKGERRFYDHQVAMSSISLSLFEPTPVGGPQIAAPVAAALRTALEVFGSSVAQVIFVVTFLIPWIAIVGLLWWTLTRLGVRWPFRNGRHILHS